ncbi:MAG TPA: histidinol dehydrogenase [Blastocatellia bacterium]|nr:histidinol dehydrogenase [Blastocatellia bacterium]
MREYYLEKLSESEIQSLVSRPSNDFGEIVSSVREILNDVKADRDRAVAKYSREFDGVELRRFVVTQQEIAEADSLLSPDVKQALRRAAANIDTFHRLQIPKEVEVETAEGVYCRLVWRAIQRVGLYVPGGAAPLASTVLMLAIPARLAGCREIVLCTPPAKAGPPSPEILYAASLCGVENIYSVGGAQAIAAMGIGTETVPKVDKIFGPGNRFVVAAKALISQPPYDVAIDMLAGPSELVVVADETANPRWVAADLLSQAEHGADSQVVLVTNSTVVASCVQRELALQVESLPRSRTIARVLDQSLVIIVTELSEAMEFVNLYAPEHLMLAVSDADRLTLEVTNAGSVFIGPHSSVVFGDYASGTNHTLPTGATAAAAGSLTVQSFMKPLAFQTVTGPGLRSLSKTVKLLARAEGLEAHARAVEIREGL